MDNFPKALWTRLQNFKDTTALVAVEEGERVSVSFWKWTRRIQNLAMALLDAGFKKGARMGFVAPNGRDWLDLAMASWLVGGCLVPLRPEMPREATLQCLGRSGCGWIAVRDETARNRLRGPGGQMPDHIQWVLFNGDEGGENIHLVEKLERRGRHLVQRGHTKKLARRIYGLDRDAPTLILFDPEPTDDSQGAFFAGYKIAVQLEALARQMGLGDEDDNVVATELSYGWFSSFLLSAAALYNGDAVTVADPDARFDEQVSTLRPTHLICGPDYLRELAQGWQDRFESAPDILKNLADNDESDASAISRALGGLGGKAARKLLYDPIREQFGGQLKVMQVFEGRCPVGLHPILEGADIALLGHFGLPETGITHVEHPQARRRDSCGRPIEGVATKLLDTKTGEVGELCIRGDTIFDEYWAGDGARDVDGEGWLHTGRQARLESGFLFLEN